METWYVSPAKCSTSPVVHFIVVAVVVNITDRCHELYCYYQRHREARTAHKNKKEHLDNLEKRVHLQRGDEIVNELAFVDDVDLAFVLVGDPCE